MSKRIKAESLFEKAFREIELATWNRPRTTGELRTFLARRESVVEDIDL
jgi:hypothetical protein